MKNMRFGANFFQEEPDAKTSCEENVERTFG
jgi:hypothetical protein